MNRKVIIVILLIIVVISIIAIIIKKNNSNISKSTINEIETMTNIEKELEQAVEKSKEYYITYGKENFEVYFGIDFINQNFIDGRISLVTNLENNLLDDNIKIYSPYGEKLEEYPTIKYEKNNYKMEEGKTYLIKVYSYMNSTNFYYTIKIDRNGNVALQPVYYTEGETDDTKGTFLFE